MIESTNVVPSAGRIPSKDHVIRYCGGSHLEKDGKPGPGAFMPRSQDQGCLSVNWLEYYSTLSDDDAKVESIRQDLDGQGITRRVSAVLALLRVGTLERNLAESNQLDVQTMHDPQPGSASHSEIRGLHADDLEIGVSLASVVRKRYPAK